MGVVGGVRVRVREPVGGWAVGRELLGGHDGWLQVRGRVGMRGLLSMMCVAGSGSPTLRPLLPDARPWVRSPRSPPPPTPDPPTRPHALTAGLANSTGPQVPRAQAVVRDEDVRRGGAARLPAQQVPTPCCRCRFRAGARRPPAPLQQASARPRAALEKAAIRLSIGPAALQAQAAACCICGGAASHAGWSASGCLRSCWRGTAASAWPRARSPALA